MYLLAATCGVLLEVNVTAVPSEDTGVVNGVNASGGVAGTEVVRLVAVVVNDAAVERVVGLAAVGGVPAVGVLLEVNVTAVPGEDAGVVGGANDAGEDVDVVNGE